MPVNEAKTLFYPKCLHCKLCIQGQGRQFNLFFDFTKKLILFFVLLVLLHVSVFCWLCSSLNKSGNNYFKVGFNKCFCFGNFLIDN